MVLANSQIQAILNDQIKVTLNGQVQEFKDETTNETQYPITYHDRTYLPLRTVANLVGVDVDYDASSNTAILKTDKSNELLNLYNYENNYTEIQSDGVKFYARVEYAPDISSGQINTGRNIVVTIGSHDNNIDFKEYKIDNSHFQNNTWYDSVGIIDLDPNDNYKEVVMRGEVEYFYFYELYRLKSTGIEKIALPENAYIIEKNNNSFFACAGSGFGCDKLLGGWIDYGYYKYENGEFKYIGKLTTGEDLFDENGNLNKRVADTEYHAGDYTELHYTDIYYKKAGEMIPISLAFKFKKIDFNNKTVNILITEYESKDTEDIKPGDELELHYDDSQNKWFFVL